MLEQSSLFGEKMCLKQNAIANLCTQAKFRSFVICGKFDDIVYTTEILRPCDFITTTDHTSILDYDETQASW
jgi:hypothetical protein